MKVAITGLGWFGFSLANSLTGSMQVCGSKSTPEGVAEVQKGGTQATLLNFDQVLNCEQPELLQNADCAILNIPPGRSTGSDPQKYLRVIEGITNLFKAGRTSHIVFISSTGVFGPQQLLVDELTRPEPTSASGMALLESENWLSTNWPGRLSILRPAGLVGGDRHPGRFLAGKQDLSGKNHPVNLVHRDDLIGLTTAIIEHDYGNRTWHAVSAIHPTKEAYYTRAAKVMGLPVPAFDPADNSEGRTVYGDISRRLTNVTFKYMNPYEML